MEIIEENQEENTTNELRTELEKSKIKLAEMENENAKNKVVMGGLCEKVHYFPKAILVEIYSIFN